ncbi:hypothetical protein CBR_g49531 [Chara braunii]|uniref:Uncharacterized protein n=1 Tax=Chara braunii TaxID=69332 RepID=A0A388M514_CHABU|nr:hypothetical protein CBR_g49531 [Chara braunii]|eukprot:GBG89678.1 hypothetical protein CBR_g49531 [Chara braunii]
MRAGSVEVKCLLCGGQGELWEGSNQIEEVDCREQRKQGKRMDADAAHSFWYEGLVRGFHNRGGRAGKGGLMLEGDGWGRWGGRETGEGDGAVERPKEFPVPA